MESFIDNTKKMSSSSQYKTNDRSSRNNEYAREMNSHANFIQTSGIRKTTQESCDCHTFMVIF